MPTGYGEAGYHQHAGNYRPPGGYKQPARGRNKGMDPTDISHAKQFNKTLQWVPDPMGDQQTLGDLYPQLRGGGGGGGGHGRGYDPYAAARAAEERRKAAMRAAIQGAYGTAIGNLRNQNAGAGMLMQAYYNQAAGRMNPIYQQNRALTADYARQLAGYAQNASRGVLDQGGALARDLMGQGGAYGLGDLRGQISGDVRNILGANAAAGQYNSRLAQVMGTNQADNRALLSAILQGGQTSREQAYQDRLAQMEAERAMKLAELA